MEEIKNNLNPSSLLELKAELLRKQAEIKKENPQPTSKRKQRAQIFKKSSVWSKQNAGVQERAQRDLELVQEEQDVMKKSQKQLEAKARLYDSMTAGKEIPEEDGSRLFLVDFQQKAIHSISERREKIRGQQEAEKQRKLEAEKVQKDQEEERRLLGETLTEPENEDEQWIDYVDSFGRSRRCMKKDLPDLQKMDARLQGKKHTEEVDSDQKELMSADMQRELVRQKWEELEKEALINPNGPMHYANVQFNEIRSHGTGYYQFSKQEESRKQQLDALKDLREQTKDMRDKKEKLKERKKAIMKARLAKVKRRKLIREGKNPDEIQSDSASSEDDDGLIGPSLGEKFIETQSKDAEMLQRDEKQKEGAPVREWDIGKEEMKIFSEEKWLQERRNERLDEFAPPQLYYDTQSNQAQGRLKGKGIGERQSQFGPPKDYFKPPESKIAKLSKSVLSDVTPSDKSIIDQERIVSGNMENHIFSNSVKLNKDPMALLEDEQCKAIRKDWLKTKDPMAMLEQELACSKESDNKIKHNVMQGLQAIRSEMGNGQNVSKENEKNTSKEPAVNAINKFSCVDQQEKLIRQTVSESLSSIPLPDSNNFKSNENNTVIDSDNLHQTEHSDRNVTSNYVDSERQKEYYQQCYNYYQQHRNYSSEGYSNGPVSQTKIPNNNPFTTHNIQTPENCSITDVNKSYTSTRETQNTEETDNKAPQPAHFSAAPTKIDPRLADIARYQRVNLYNVPDQLPAPPSELNVPQYPSMEEVAGTKPDAGHNKSKMSEEALQKSWYRQFGNKGASLQFKQSEVDHKVDKSVGIDRIKHVNIPFVSPYVQKDSVDEDISSKEVEYDPSKPPPSVTSV